MVPEPTHEMLDAAREATQGRAGHMTDARLYREFVIPAIVAAAPPEYLLRVALSEEEVHWLVFALEELFPGSSAPMLQAASYASVSGKLSRALRGGEDTRPADMPPWMDPGGHKGSREET